MLNQKNPKYPHQRITFVIFLVKHHVSVRTFGVHKVSVRTFLCAMFLYRTFRCRKFWCYAMKKDDEIYSTRSMYSTFTLAIIKSKSKIKDTIATVVVIWAAGALYTNSISNSCMVEHNSSILQDWGSTSLVCAP